MYSFCDKLIEEKRKTPDTSIISDVVAALDQKGLTKDQVLHATTTIINGFPTPFPVLSVATVELLRHPDVINACKKDPSLWQKAVSELLRYKAHFAFALPRVAMENITLGNETIQSGQVVLPSLTAAGHDPKYTERPDEFDIYQQAHRGSVFGAGSHFCPGAPLSRQWLEVGLQELFTELPNLRLAVREDQLKWQKGSLSTPETIPVTTS